MKKGLLIGIIVVVLLIAVAGFYFMNTPTTLTKTSSSTSSQGTVAGQGSMVSIKSYNFNPTTVNIRVGETITWTNEDSAPHTIVSDSGKEISSSSLSNGQTYSHTFSTAGTYDYHCSIHPSMKATIIVK